MLTFHVVAWGFLWHWSLVYVITTLLETSAKLSCCDVVAGARRPFVSQKGLLAPVTVTCQAEAPATASHSIAAT